MPDETRVFDVSKPSKVSPPATSKPVIVGHHPVMNDPMVKDDNNFISQTSNEATKIPVFSDSSPTTIADAMAAHEAEPPAPAEPEHSSIDHGSPAVFSEPQEEENTMPPAPESPTAEHSMEHPAESVANGPFTEAQAEPAQPDIEPTSPLPGQPEPHIEGLHFAAPTRRRNPLKWLLAAVFLLIIAGYLLIDSGAINAGFKLPFHIFKQKTQPVSNPSPPPQSQSNTVTPSVPAGFKEYKISDTNIVFAAPAAWGEPTSATDPGFSKRSAGAQSDGTYAYLVNFATNKDIQVAVTSAKFLPTTRATLYYDYLQWCTGTNDGQTYESILHFVTANKVDTPTTITCDQGPVPGVTKIDSTTIVQAKAADTSNKVIGDIYTKNLKDPSLVVLRVKDAAMTNGSDIKQLLNTVKVTQSSTSSTSGQ